MNTNPVNQKEHFRDVIDPYLSKWKFILLCVIAAVALAFMYLRYANYEYQANATIKIKDDEANNQMPEVSSLQNYGLFRRDANNVLDEVEVIKSRALIAEVIKDLKYNIQFFVEGRIQDHEIYTNPPLNINFSVSDSIIHKIDTTLIFKYIQVRLSC